MPTAKKEIPMNKFMIEKYIIYSRLKILPYELPLLMALLKEYQILGQNSTASQTKY
jgi:hypothetical protein